MPVYTETVMDHFRNPRNVGVIENPDGVGEEGNPVCGDMMTFYIKVDNDRISDVKFQTFGCGAAIAVSSMVSEMAKGKTLEEARKITPDTVAEQLGGLPKNKFHCSNLGAQALTKAIEDYESKKAAKGAAIKEAREVVGAKETSKTDEKPLRACCCPYCDAEVESKESPICKACGVTLKTCPGCKTAVEPQAKLCPKCGKALK